MLETSCIVLAGPRDAAMDVEQLARLEAASPGGWIVGGTAAVPDEKVAGHNLARLSGVDRWHTTRLVGVVAANLNQFTQLRLTAHSKLSTQGLGLVHNRHQLEDALTASGVGFSVGDYREVCAVYIADVELIYGPDVKVAS